MFLGLLFSSAYAQDTQSTKNTYFSKKPVVCGTIEEIIGTSQKWGEVPFFRADGSSLQENGSFIPTTYIMGYNKETKSWSLIEIVSKTHACMLGTGKGLQLFAQKLGIAL